MRSGLIQILFMYMLSGLLSLQAQINKFGVPLISSYELNSNSNGLNRCITLDHRGLVYLGDPELGVMEYDGSEWRNIPGTANLGVRSLACGNDGVVYVGAEDDFGLLKSDLLGQLSFHSLYDSADTTAGLTILENKDFKDLPGGDFFVDREISAVVRLDNGHLLVATRKNGIYQLDHASGEFKSFFKNQVTDLKVVGQKLYVCTRNQGLFVLDHQGQILEIISQNEGLPDHSISGIHVQDEQNGKGPIWIAHSRGISKIDINNPLRIYAGEVKFEEEITDLVHFNGLLFVSTLGGLYYQTRTSSGGSFQKLTKLPGAVHDLQLFRAGRYRSLLLASTGEGIFIIHPNRWVTPLVPTQVQDQGDSLNADLIGGRVILADPQRSGVIYTGLNRVVGLQYSRGRWYTIFRSKRFDQGISQMVRDHYGYLWVSTPGKLSRIDMELAPDYITTDYSGEIGLPFDRDLSLFLKPNSKDLWIGTDSGFYLFNYFQEKFIPDSVFNSILPPESGRIGNIYVDRDGDYWISYNRDNHGWTELVVRNRDEHPRVLLEKPLLRLPSAAPAGGWSVDPDSGIWISKSKDLYYFNKSDQINDSLSFQTLIRRVVIDGDSGLYFGADVQMERPRIDFKYNSISFDWAGSSFEAGDSLEFSYFLKGSGSSWSPWQSMNHLEFSGLRYGRYILELKARNIYGQEGMPASFSFVILRPWHATLPAIGGYMMLGFLVVYLLLKRFRK